MESSKALENAMTHALENKGAGRVQSREGRGLPQNQPVYSPVRSNTVPTPPPAKIPAGHRLAELKDSVQEEITELEAAREHFNTNRNDRSYLTKIANAKKEVADAERALREAKERLAQAELDRGPFQNYLDTEVEADRIVGA
jgi:hypothetical protein